MKKNIIVISILLLISICLTLCILINGHKDKSILRPRMGHSTIKIPNSQNVLVVGGVDKQELDFVNSIELYNLEREHSIYNVPTVFSHILPDLFINSDGNIAIIDNGSIEIYNVKEHKIISANKNPFALDDYINETQRLQIANDIIFITGGKSSLKEYVRKGQKEMAISDKTYLYDIRSNKVIKSFNLKIPRTNHQTILYNGFVYLFGGNTPKNTDAVLIEKINLANNTSEIIGKLKQARANHTALNVGNLVYLIGGNSDSIEIYDIENNKSILKKNFKFSNTYQSLDKHNIYVVNINQDSISFLRTSQKKYLSGLYEYDLKKEKIKKLKNLKIGNYASITKLENNSILIIGGEKQILMPNFMKSKICVIDKLCTSFSASNKVFLTDK